MDGYLRPADDLLAPAVAEAIASLPEEPRDAAAARLACAYAEAVDNASDPEKALADLGPKLLAVLDALGLTPRGRAAVKGGVSSGQSGNSAADALAKLRERRAAR